MLGTASYQRALNAMVSCLCLACDMAQGGAELRVGQWNTRALHVADKADRAEAAPGDWGGG